MKDIYPPKSESLLVLQLMGQLMSPGLASQHTWVLLCKTVTLQPPCCLSHRAPQHHQFPGFSRRDQCIRADPVTTGKDAHQLLLRPHLKQCVNFAKPNSKAEQSTGGAGSIPSVTTQLYTSNVLTTGCLLSLVTLVTRESGVMEHECFPPNTQVQRSHLELVVPSLADTIRAQQWWPCR